MATGGSMTGGNRKLVERYVERRVASLQERRDSPPGRALLAQLRRSVSKRPGEVPETWDFEYAYLPDSLSGKADEPPTPGEWAAHLALSLYAVHQQSQTLPMHRTCDWSEHKLFGLGHAVRRMAAQTNGEQLEQGQMPRRFAALVTADSIEEVAHYLRQIVQQLRSASLPLDYGRLAGQLYDYQKRPQRNRVRLEWGREYSQANMAPTSAGDDAAENLINKQENR